MVANSVLDVIINLVVGAKNENLLSCQINDETIQLGKCDYLLGQVLRNLVLDESHYLVSEAALSLWQQISDDSIFSYTYRDTVVVTKPNCPVVDKYTGSQKSPRATEQLRINEKFIFNDVFTDEHIVPINIVIKQLKDLRKLSYDNVLAILDKIYICKVLKDEDRKIQNKNNREDNYLIVLYTDYWQAGIKVHGIPYDESSVVSCFKKHIECVEQEIKNLQKCGA